MLGWCLSRYAKKRQSDLIGFCVLIIFILYTGHVMACIWLALGFMSPCSENISDTPCV